jgi:hypothetical protein
VAVICDKYEQYRKKSEPSRRANNSIDHIDMNIEYQAGMLITLESKHDNAGCRRIPVIDVFLTVHHELTIIYADYYLFIKYYSPLHVLRLKCSSSRGYSCIHAAYGTVTLYESSWWPVGTQLETCRGD